MYSPNLRFVFVIKRLTKNVSRSLLVEPCTVPVLSSATFFSVSFNKPWFMQMTLYKICKLSNIQPIMTAVKTSVTTSCQNKMIFNK